MPESSNHNRLLWVALGLSLGAAISLGVTRFAYGLLLPPMRVDLGWSYALAGSMNTSNALGYLLGALSTPLLMRRLGATQLLMVGAALASFFMGLSGFFSDTSLLLLQRLLAGISSAWVFVAGGVLAAQLGVRDPAHSGLLLGLYYGGTGFGIVISALLVPVTLAAVDPILWGYPGWAWAWWLLGLMCAVATLLLLQPVRWLQRQAALAPLVSAVPTATVSVAASPRWRSFACALAGYGMFGVGYIGYMTFIIALLREQGAGVLEVTAFYTLLGLAVVGSSRLWAGLLDRHRSGRALATLNLLLGVAAIIPALTAWWPLLLLSGIVFGAVFLSVVASTTAFVRHNFAPVDWPRGISAFTVVFAAGQIIGPVLVGWISDAAQSGLGQAPSSGLARGLLVSALCLWFGALLASHQKALR